MTVFFLFERKAAKKTAEIIRVQNIDSERIELSLNDYYSVLEEENEIVLNGKYFDISDTKIINDRIILSGNYDDNETKLIEWFDGLPNKKAIQFNIYNFLDSLFIERSTSFSFLTFKNPSQTYFFSFLHSLPPSFFFYQPPK